MECRIGTYMLADPKTKGNTAAAQNGWRNKKPASD